MSLDGFRNMDNWAKASKEEYTCYRLTKKGFRDSLTSGNFVAQQKAFSDIYIYIYEIDQLAHSPSLTRSDTTLRPCN